MLLLEKKTCMNTQGSLTIDSLLGWAGREIHLEGFVKDCPSGICNRYVQQGGYCLLWGMTSSLTNFCVCACSRHTGIPVGEHDSGNQWKVPESDFLAATCRMELIGMEQQWKWWCDYDVMVVLQSSKAAKSHKCTAIDGCQWSALDWPGEWIAII